MTSTDVAYRVLIVDDDAQMIADLREVLSEELTDLGEIHFESEQDFSAAEQRLIDEDFDLVILDVRDAADGRPSAAIEGRGHELYDAIAGARWLPVVFFTAVPQQVRDLEKPPLIRVVTKNAWDEVAPAVRDGLLSGVSELRRRISGLVERKVRVFLRDVVAPHWHEMAGADPHEITPIIVNRLAAELRENGPSELGYAGDGEAVATAGQPSAARVYLKPCVTHHLTATDLVVNPEGDWWIVLTPACDLYEDHPDANVARPRKAKAQYVRLAKADRIFTEDGEESESPAIATWLASTKSNSHKDQAKQVFGDKQNRYRALPGYLDIPDLLVDFENVVSVPLAEARTWRRVATLDSPFSEAMLIAYSRSVGRIGTPDLSFDDVKVRLELEKPKARHLPTQASTPSANGEVVKD
ncbi:hypothetical protein [Streptomyces sp. CC208A]|uniref:hypothetical protein n=1 Tax=Streptomyces sp. CC208A TaxID=3044573 RepID=UPI0024A7F41E|nr:hypothetical protein [Streptomyces sp. CC208A]